MRSWWQRMNYETHQKCGGTILTADSGTGQYDYCDRCRAFIYWDEYGDGDGEEDGQGFPAGIDEKDNRQAWDDGESMSPDYFFEGEGEEE